jgi:hypothetical protein
LRVDLVGSHGRWKVSALKPQTTRLTEPSL